MTVLLVVVLAAFGLGAGFLVVRDWYSSEAAQLRKRLADEFDSPQEDARPGSLLFKNLDQAATKVRPQSATPLTAIVRWHDRLRDWLDQGSLPLTPAQMLLVCAGLLLLGGAALAWFRGPILGCAGAFVGGAAPWAVLWVRRNARHERMLKQLPSVFDLMARAVRGGQSVPQALQAVSESFNGPLAAEFARCQKQLNLGLAPEIALGELAERTAIVEVRIFVMSLLIQRQVGGSLAETMDRLAAMVRSRLALRNQVRTLTAEGRLQGWTLVVLPFVIFAAMMVINRPYAEILLDHGRLIALALVSMTVGILWIRRIVNFEI